ncbi:PREDICTED: testis-specific serine/threonine-protein kinase 4-like [Priapulus caudatus]|uniref:Testis-specific serine/threonine-protein kinase 4-like n=1 Tax=Priapulus caudatus TaxID=37621 RepID=A0ABM1E0B3_PRICU|nr:PREDICTED: testis-specific serine/threonine-protein kinase 4-like [Priapulus caudatus]
MFSGFKTHENKQAVNENEQQHAEPEISQATSPGPNETIRAKQMTVLEAHGYTLGKTLGHGSYATVKEAYSSRHKTRVAIKVISKRKSPSDFIDKFLPREIEVIKLLKHRCLVTFLQSIETTNRVYMIMEVCDNGDLLDVIKTEKYIAERQAGFWFHQLIDGLVYLHSKGIVHRDLKCENLLLDKRNTLKITDYGFARYDVKSSADVATVLSETYCGSYAYAPPEILCGIPYDPQRADIWSAGIVLFTMVFGRLPFDDSNHKTLVKQVQGKIFFPSEPTVPGDCRNLITIVLCNARERATLNTIRQDDWYKRVRPENIMIRESIKALSTHEASYTPPRPHVIL